MIFGGSVRYYTVVFLNIMLERYFFVLGHLQYYDI